MVKEKKSVLVLALLSTLTLGGALIGVIKPLRSKSYDLSLAEQKIPVRLDRVGDVPCRQKLYYLNLEFTSEVEGWLSCDDVLWQTMDGGKTWVKVWEDTNQYSLLKFHFMNALVGWRYSISEIYKTTDGGHTWTPVNIPIDEGEVISIYFLNDNQGWLAGAVYTSDKSLLRKHQKILSGRKEVIVPAIFHTNDGGRTWRQQQISGEPETVAHDLTVIEGKLWVSAGVNLFYLEGDKWIEINYQRGDCPRRNLLTSTGIGGNYGDGVAPINIHFADGQNGWLVFPNGYIAKTTDGGNTWCDLFYINDNQDKGKTFVEVYFKDPKHGWGLDNRGEFYESKDGGETWVKIEINGKYEDMYFLDANHGWVTSKEGLFRINTR